MQYLKANQKLIIVIIVILLVWWVIRPDRMEPFNQNTTEFVPVGSDRYGLRSDPLRRRSIDDYYIVNRQIRLHPTSNMMYESNKTPEQEGVQGCRRVACPTNTNEYDAGDSCWMCGDECQSKLDVKSIWSHS